MEVTQSTPDSAPQTTAMPGEMVSEALEYITTAETPAGGRVFASSHRCPDKTTPNEDSLAVFTLSPLAMVLVVADGVGGHAAGEVASRLSVEALAARLAPLAALPPDDLVDRVRPAILDGIEAANDAVRQLGNGAATTLAIVEIQGPVARSYHVGDSGILIVGQRGKIKHESMAHSPVGYAIGAGLLTPSEAMFHEDRHVVENVVGAAEMRIEIGPPVTLSSRDTLLVASDGLFDNLHIEEIVAAIRSGQLARKGRAMIDEARRRMRVHDSGHPSKPDDLTAILYRRGR